MKVVYTGHLENRLMMRGIEHDLPRRIFEESREKYFDSETGHLNRREQSETPWQNQRGDGCLYFSGRYREDCDNSPFEGKAKRKQNQDGKMEEGFMKDFKVFYDEKEDIL